MTQRQPDDMPPEQWRRFVPEEEAAAHTPDFSMQDPVAVGMTFIHGLDDPAHNFDLLQSLSTPESVEKWGDYTAAASVLQAIPDIGFGSRTEPSVGDHDVQYFKVMRGVSSSFQVLDDQFIDLALVLTLIWRREYNEWRVHGMGNYIRPEDVPH